MIDLMNKNKIEPSKNIWPTSPDELSQCPAISSKMLHVYVYMLANRYVLLFLVCGHYFVSILIPTKTGISFVLLPSFTCQGHPNPPNA
jgi:hypothetical protein